MTQDLTNSDLSAKTARRLLCVGLFVAAAVYLFPITWGLPTGGPATWAFDEIPPARVELPEHWSKRYPPTHRHVLTPIVWAAGKIGETGVVDAWGLDHHGGKVVAMRAVSVVLGCATLWLLYLCARRFLDRKASLLAVASLAFGTNYVFYAKTANLDIPYVFWFALSLYFLLQCLDRRRWHDYVLFAVCGTLAITTKSQAYALYLPAPLLLVLDLRQSQPPESRSFWRALFDRRILEAAGATLATLLVVFGEPWGSGDLRSHIDAVRSFPYEGYRAHSSAPGAWATATFRHLVFNTGAPLLAITAVGVVRALWRPRRHRRMLQLLFLAGSYYIAFILVTGFNYDRHYLPILLVLSLFSGKALGDLLRGSRIPLTLRSAAVVLVLGHALLRGVSVDLMLWGDARYEAESWLHENGLTSEVLGLGPRPLLPRGIAALTNERFATWTRGEHDTNPRVWHNCLQLDRLATDYVIPVPASELAGPGVNYAEHVRFRNRAPFSVVRFDRLPAWESNVVKVARDTVVFRRTDEECVDSGLIPRALHELRFTRDRQRRDAVARGLLESPGSKARPLAGSEDMFVARAYADGWTAGPQPAGVVIRNRGYRPYRPSLVLDFEGLELASSTSTGGHDVPAFPLTVFLEDGKETRSVPFDRPESRTVELAPVAAGQSKLVIVWTDHALRDPEGRLLGVRLAPAPRRVRPPRAGRPSRAFEELSRTLAGLAAGTGDVPRERLVEAIVRGGVHAPVELQADAIMVGGRHGGWTYGTSPAGLLLQNTGREASCPRLSLSCEARTSGASGVVTIEDGSGRTDHVVDCKGSAIRLEPMSQGSRRLYLLWSHRTSEGSPPRGIRVAGVDWDRAGSAGCGP